MTAPVSHYMQVLAGATGASHAITSKPFDGFIPGQVFYFGATYEATRSSGTDTCQLRLQIEWFTSAGAALTATNYDTTINATVAKTYVEAKHTAPATAAYGKLKVIITPLASPMQHTVKVHSVRLGLTERAADVTSAVAPAAVSSTFTHDYAGTADTGQFPRSISFNLQNALGNVASGVTWTYTVVTGTVNGYTSASGPQAMSGTGPGTITINSLGSTTAEVKVTALYGGATRTGNLYLNKTFSAAPGGGGGSGGTNINASVNTSTASSTFSDGTGTKNAVLSSSSTTLRLTMTLDIAVEPGPGSYSEVTVEAKFQRNISGTWTDQGAVQSAMAYWEDDPELGITDAHGYITFSHDITGLTASSSQDCRIMVRETGASARTANITGTFTGVSV